jgi:hypothetical protein
LAEFDDNFRVAPGISNITANHFEEGLAHDDDFTHLDHEISRKFYGKSLPRHGHH